MTFGSILYTILISPLQMLFEFIFDFAQQFTNDYGISIIVLSLVMFTMWINPVSLGLFFIGALQSFKDLWNAAFDVVTVKTYHNAVPRFSYYNTLAQRRKQ